MRTISFHFIWADFPCTVTSNYSMCYRSQGHWAEMYCCHKFIKFKLLCYLGIKMWKIILKCHLFFILFGCFKNRYHRSMNRCALKSKNNWLRHNDHTLLLCLFCQCTVSVLFFCSVMLSVIKKKKSCSVLCEEMYVWRETVTVRAPVHVELWIVEI